MAATKAAVDEWFKDRGVPRFVVPYDAGDAVRRASAVLGVLFAFELTAQPHETGDWEDWIGAPAPDPGWTGTIERWAPFLSPAFVVVALTTLVPLGRVLRRVWRRDATARAVWQLPAAGLLASWPLWLRLVTDDVPWLWQPPWVEFATVVAAATAAVLALQHAAWVKTARCRALRVVLELGVLIAAAGLAADRAWAGPIREHVRDLEENLSPRLPAAAFALVALAGVWLLRRWGRAAVAARDARAPRQPPGAQASLAVLLALFAVETSVLPLVRGDRSEDAKMILLVLAGFVVLRLLSLVPVIGAAIRRVSLAVYLRGQPIVMRREGLAMMGVAFVLVYPAMAAWDDREALTFLAMFGMNAVYVALTAAAIGFGLHHVLDWATLQVLRRAKTVTVAVSTGVPLLMVAAVVLFLTAETWQVTSRVSTERFLALPAFLLALAALFLVVGGWTDLSHACRFKSRAALREALRAPDCDLDDETWWALEREAEKHLGSGELAVPMRLVERLNALAVLLVYQVLVLGAVMAVTFASFLALGHLLMDEKVFEAFGVWTSPVDRTPNDVFSEVAALLAALAVLTTATESRRGPEQQETFYSGAIAGVRQRLAVLLLYKAAYGEAPDRPSGAPARER